MASERLGDGPQELLLGTHCCAADEGHKDLPLHCYRLLLSPLSFYSVSKISAKVMSTEDMAYCLEILTVAHISTDKHSNPQS